jgi:hypothetical protein
MTATGDLYKPSVQDKQPPMDVIYRKIHTLGGHSVYMPSVPRYLQDLNAQRFEVRTLISIRNNPSCSPISGMTREGAVGMWEGQSCTYEHAQIHSNSNDILSRFLSRAVQVNGLCFRDTAYRSLPPHVWDFSRRAHNTTS